MTNTETQKSNDYWLRDRWFESRQMQVEPRFFRCFGIRVEDRFGGERYIKEMMSFCRACAENAVAHLVEEVFYDKGDVCYITTSTKDRPEEHALVVQAARETICQFVVDDGFVDHGGPLVEHDEAMFMTSMFAGIVKDIRQRFNACPAIHGDKCPLGQVDTEQQCVECWNKAMSDIIVGDAPF